MNVLVINCGSSSLKFQLINAESEEVLAKGICEKIGRRRKRGVGKGDADPYRGNSVCD